MQRLLSPLALVLLFSVQGCGDNDNESRVDLLEPADAPAPVDIVRSVPIEAVFYNECCNEDVYLTGTAQFVVSKNIIHVGVSDISGTGLSSGVTYTGVGTSTETNVFYSNQLEGTFVFYLNVANQNGCSFRTKLTSHTSVNANGDVTAVVDKVQAQCR